MLEEIFSVGLLKIIGVNLVLSGDNAVVIALAARNLPPKQQKQAVFIGAGAAVVLRIILTLVAAALLTLPWIKIAGALLLLWVGVQLLLPEKEAEDDESAEAASSMFGAIRTILIADLVMSLDNVIAVAAAAGDSFALLLIGLAISIPIVIFASTFLIKLMERWPIIITIGAALIGYVAGEMLISDPAIRHWEESAHAFAERTTGGLIEPAVACGIIGALLVIAIGGWFARRQPKHGEKLEHVET